MKRFIQNISMVFAAGCIGGLANSMTLWVFGTMGIMGAPGVRIAPGLTPTWLYPRIVWGGIWGVLFLLPFLHRYYFWRGLLYSLGPTVVQLFIVFPLKGSQGVMGLSLGALTPIFVFVFNLKTIVLY